jgi:hypothetical protein
VQQIPNAGKARRNTGRPSDLGSVHHSSSAGGGVQLDQMPLSLPIKRFWILQCDQCPEVKRGCCIDPSRSPKWLASAGKKVPESVDAEALPPAFLMTLF